MITIGILAVFVFCNFTSVDSTTRSLRCINNNCNCLGQTVDCSNRNLQEMPKNIPEWVENLDLSSNELNDSIAVDIPKYPKLLELKLNKNLLHSIPVISNVNLTTLILSHNKIPSFNNKTLMNLRHLKNLDLSSNHLSELKVGMFPNVSEIRTLILNNNNIAKIENGSLDSLASLNELKLNKNNLSVLTKLVFSHLSHLEVLELSRNRLTEISGLSFKGLGDLITLKIRQNSIHTLEDGAFFGLMNLHTLHLDENKIKKVKKGWLYGLTSLGHLSLSHNIIQHIEGGWEFCQQLTDLDLSYNKLHEIEKDSLMNLVHLERLLLDSNQILSIAEGAFNHTPSLSVLELNNNKISWTFEDTNGVFVGLKKLKKLGLAGNMITLIHQKAFLGLDGLMELDLRGNSILTLQENAFALVPILSVLELNTTMLLCDCDLAWFPHWLQTTVNPVPEVSCGYPRWLQGQMLTRIPSDKFLCLPNDSPKPRIMEEPSSQVVLAGSEVTLSCHARSSSESPMTFKWKRNNQEVEKLTTSSGGEQSSDLHFHNVTLTHSAKYQCIVSNTFGTTYSHKAELNVLVFPVLIKRPNNVTAEVGKTVQLDCAASGQPPPQIAWQKDGGNEFPAAQERRMHVLPTDDVFFIVNVKAMDTGIYSCTARNTAGMVVANASLTVLEAPSFAKPMEDKAVGVGETIVLECMSSGSPRPKLVWTKDGRPLMMTERHVFTADDQLLIIMNSVHSDAGVYECELSNELGIERGRSRLKVLTMYGAGVNDTNLIGIIVITVVFCAVFTSALWVTVIYHSRRARRASSPPPVDGLRSTSYHSDHSRSSKDSGTGDSTRRASHEDLLLGTVNCVHRMNEDRDAMPEVSLPLLTTFHPYGETSSSSSVGVYKKSAAVAVVPCCHLESGTVPRPAQVYCPDAGDGSGGSVGSRHTVMERTDHNRCCSSPGHLHHPNSYLCVYLPPPPPSTPPSPPPSPTPHQQIV